MHKARRRRTFLRRRKRGLHLAAPPSRTILPKRRRPQHLAPPEPWSVPAALRPALAVATVTAAAVALSASDRAVDQQVQAVDTSLDTAEAAGSTPPTTIPVAVGATPTTAVPPGDGGAAVPSPAPAEASAATGSTKAPRRSGGPAPAGQPASTGGDAEAAATEAAATALHQAPAPAPTPTPGAAPAPPAAQAPPAAAVPAPTPPAPRVTNAAGGFRVDGTNFVDPAGSRFVPLGVNLLGPNTWWDRPTQGLSDAARTWGFNLIRLNTNYYDSGIHTNNDLAGIVAEYTGKGIVVMIEMHSFGNGGYPQADQLAVLQGWWARTANQFKDNPYVWFNPMNEPGFEQTVPEAWRTVNEAVIQAIRGTGAGNPIVLDGAAFGQDAFSWHTGPVNPASSAILTYGPDLAARYANVAFSFHVYDQWTGGDARMADYIQRVHAAGLALMAGEVGDAGYVNGAYHDFTPAFDTCIRVCAANGVGVIAWHGQGTGAGEGFRLVDDGPIDTIDNPINPGNLTHAGQAIWALGH